jgi:serine/threonine protein kinase
MATDKSIPKVIGIGSSGIVTTEDGTTVLKGHTVVSNGRVTHFRDDFETVNITLAQEHRAYERLGSHKNIAQYMGRVQVQPGVYSLRLELAPKGDLRAFIETHTSAEIGFTLRLTWAADLAAGLAHAHSKGVFHCDFSCRNILLTERNGVKICDFGGAAIDDEESLGIEESRYQLPLRGRRQWDDRPVVKRDIFALGCAVYEIMAWKKPFADLADHEVDILFRCERFPDLSRVPCAAVIRTCWDEEFDKAEDVVVALRAVIVGQEYRES